MQGLTRINEDSSEIAFLLVENYTMTTPYGLRIVWEFLDDPAVLTDRHLFIAALSFMDGCEEEISLRANLIVNYW